MIIPPTWLTRVRALTRSQLRVNAISGLAMNVVSALITVVGYRIYLQQLGYEKYALWLILSTVLVVVQVGNFGISPALQKLIAEDFAGKNIDGVYRYLVSATVALAAGGALVMVMIMAGRHLIVFLFGLSGQSSLTVYTLLPYVGALSIYVIIVDSFNSALAGLGRYDLVNYTQTAAQFISLSVTVIGLRMGWDLWSFLAGTLFGYLFLTASSVILIRRLTPSGRSASLRLDKHRLLRLVRFGSWIFGSSVLTLVLNPINRVLIARYIGVSSITIYDIAYTSAMKIRAFIETGFRPLTPALSNLRASDPELIYERLTNVERTGTRFILYWGTAFYLLVCITAPWTLRLWLGPKFSPVLPRVFQIMMCGTYFSLWGVQAYYTLLGLGRSVHIMNCYAIALVLDVGLIYLAAFSDWWRPFPLEAVVASVSIGYLGSTLYLRFQALRLRADLRADLSRTDGSPVRTR